MGDTPPSGRRLIYGRQKSRPLSKRQKKRVEELLPSLRLDLSQAPDTQLSNALKEQQVAWIEIGFGGGEHLAWQAEKNPHVTFIGCEPFINGMAKILGVIETRQLKNIRLYDDDARDILDWLEPSTIDRAFILYPDPWPKKRHHKRRFLNPANFARLARVLKPGAQLRIATDIGDYARSLLLAYRANGEFIWTARGPNDWRQRPADWPPTRYEEKAMRAGRKCTYFIFLRK